MAMPRSRPLPPYLPPLVEKVRLRELQVPSAEMRPTSSVPAPQSTAAVIPSPVMTPSLHPLVEQASDIEAMASVLLSALEQENSQTARHHTRIAKHIVGLARTLNRDLKSFLVSSVSDSPPSQPPKTEITP